MTASPKFQEFILDSRLAADSILLGETGICQIRLMNDQRYPWLLVIPQLNEKTEWHQLDPDTSVMVHRVCVELGQRLKQHFECTKINIAALGNVVPQLHIHVIGRSASDPAWPGPVWGHSPAVPYASEILKQRQHELVSLIESLPL